MVSSKNNSDPGRPVFPGVTVEEQMVAVDPQVSLRVTVFRPEKPTDRPAVVFVAGWMTLIDSWIEVLGEMTRDFVVVYVETREKKSSRIRGRAGFGVAEIGADVVRVVDHFGLKDGRYVIVASSLGATSVMDRHGEFRPAPRALVMINPNAVFRIPAFWKQVVRFFYPPLLRVLRPVVKWYLRTFRLDIHSDPAQYKKYCATLDNADPWKSKLTAMAIWDYQIWDRLPSLRFPTLIVGASRDKLHEPENMKRMVSLIPRATYLDMETNARNHSPELVKEIRRYLEKSG
jgi:pimeloyl-ACP methyl ester carboxylesterase